MSTADPCKAYRQSAIHSESTADIFIQLYDQLSSLLHSAALAIEARDIEKKTADIGRAFTILIHLQGALDFERGGEVAVNLNQFYKLVRNEASEGSFKLDAALLRQAAAHVGELRGIWEQAQALTLRQNPPAAAVTSDRSPSQSRPRAPSFSSSPTEDDIPAPQAWSA
ncbi:MAG TPA: flagellar export chaperone FliS [Terriglobia bacterium]|nr:flagellar export chaperone FliS [Terriglobia bacterium]